MIPKARECEHRLVDDGDVERRLAALIVEVPLEKAGGNLEAPLAALPWPAIARRSLHRLDPRVDRRVLRRLALGEERNQPPADARALMLTVDGTNDRNLLGRRHIKTRRKLPIGGREMELALDRGNIGGHVAAAHGWVA